MIDRLIGFLDRNRTIISVAAAAWFILGIAVSARFVTLPELPRWASQAIFWSSVAANAGWWGFLRPRIENRRAHLAAVTASPE